MNMSLYTYIPNWTQEDSDHLKANKICAKTVCRDL